jgi:hypothetical protein
VGLFQLDDDRAPFALDECLGVGAVAAIPLRETEVVRVVDDLAVGAR